jgi:hypothetical protein
MLLTSLFLSLFTKVLQSGPALYYSVEIILISEKIFRVLYNFSLEYTLFIHAFLSLFSYSNFTIDHISHLIWNGYWMDGSSIELVGAAPSPPFHYALLFMKPLIDSTL